MDNDYGYIFRCRKCGKYIVTDGSDNDCPLCQSVSSLELSKEDISQMPYRYCTGPLREEKQMM